MALGGIVVANHDHSGDAGDGGTFLPVRPICILERAANQTLTDTVADAIAWDTEDEDASGMHDPGTNPSRITIAQAGVYEVCVVVGFDASAAGTRIIEIQLNGVSLIETYIPAAQADFLITSLTFHVRAAATNYIEIFATQTSGGNLDALGGFTHVSVALISA